MNIEDSDNNNREDERSDDNQKKEETLLRSSENSLKQRSSVGSHRSSTLEYPDDPEDAKDRKSVLYNVAGYIIVTEFCERLAYYTFATSLVLFFQVIYRCHLSLLSSCIDKVSFRVAEYV